MKTETIDIDTMPAGREMDALVAEAMGWKRSKRTHHEYWEGRFEFLTSPDGHQIYRVENVGDWVGNTHESEIYFREKCSYSTSIAAAWEVAEKLANEAYAMYLYCGGAASWHCNFGQSWEGTLTGHADTAPLAICRAALKATERS